MELNVKIITIYPELDDVFYNPLHNPPYVLQNDGQGTYIKQWSYHLPQPTQQQLDELN